MPGIGQEHVQMYSSCACNSLSAAHPVVSRSKFARKMSNFFEHLLNSLCL